MALLTVTTNAGIRDHAIHMNAVSGHIAHHTTWAPISQHDTMAGGLSPHCSRMVCCALQWRFLVSIIVASLFGLGFMAAILGYARHKRLLFIPSPVNIR